MLKAADTRLKFAKLPRGSSIATLPVATVIGLPGSAKTSIMAHSGIDPELLAGAMSEGGAIAGTPAVNVWYSCGTVFVEPSGNTLLDEGKWRALLIRIRPARLRSTLGKSAGTSHCASVFRRGDACCRPTRGRRTSSYSARQVE